jgi:hypothetical protein
MRDDVRRPLEGPLGRIPEQLTIVNCGYCTFTVSAVTNVSAMEAIVAHAERTGCFDHHQMHRATFRKDN